MAHGNGPGAGSDRVSPPAGGVGEIRSTRRELLRGSLGAAILLAGGRAFAGTTGARAAPGALGPYFVFGTPNPSTADDPSLIAGAATTTAPLAHRLVTPPLRSRDRSRLALVSVEDVGGSAGVIATVVDTRSGAVAASGTLRLADAPDALILVTPALSPDATTLCLAISITTPTNWRVLSKLNPVTGATESRRVATWVSSHAIAYFDTRRQSFAGPFVLDDAPSLASVNVASTASDFCVWTMAEPAAVRGTKENPKPTPIPSLSIYPFGSGKPRVTTPAPAVWPVNREPTATLANGNFVRLVADSTLEVYSARDGASQSRVLSPFDVSTTRPTRTRMDQRRDGSLFISNPGLGQALLLDGANPAAVRARVTPDVREQLAGSHAPQAQLSDDGNTLYALGPNGGVDSYLAASSRRARSIATDRQFTALYRLSSGGLAATSLTSPNLTFFDDSLQQVGTADTNFYIDGVF